MRKRFGCFGMILFVLLCLSILFNLVLLAFSSRRISSRLDDKPPEYDESVVVSGSGSSNDKIALIYLNGIISSSLGGSLGDSMVDDIKIALRQAGDDGRVKAIVLNVDSPGG